LLLLSVLVGFIDGVGLALFMPLLQLVSDSNALDADAMGNLAFIIQAINTWGITISLDSLLILILIIFLAKGILTFFETYYRVSMRVRFVKMLRFQMIDGIANLKYQAYLKSDAGKIQNTLSAETNQVVQAFVHYVNSLQAAFVLVVYMSLAFLANAEFAFLVTVGGLATILIYRNIYKSTKKLSIYAVQFAHRFQGLLIQSVHYFKYMKATATIEKFAKRLKDQVYQMVAIQKRMGALSAILSASREPLIIGVVIAVIFLQLHFFGGKLTTILLSLMLFYRSLNALMQVQYSYNNFLNKVGSINNAIDFLKYLDDNQDSTTGKELTQLGSSVKMKSLHFAYEPDTPVLTDINLDIRSNETIAFVGESGSGKTTIMNIIVGLLDEYRGELFINEQDYHELKKKSIQHKMGYITQEPVVFSDTVFNNITLWAPKTEENVKRFNEVLTKAALFEFVQTLPQKEDSHLGDNGIQISGGQKQRLSIARELYKNVDFLLLDEATSALDSQTEKIIQRNIDELKGHYTIVIVAHRLSTVRNADRIVVLNNGQVDGIGTFNELVQSNQRFSKMVQLQEF
jgi:ABC-type multidrug transport system fused ATPase/permease subunit